MRKRMIGIAVVFALVAAACSESTGTRRTGAVASGADQEGIAAEAPALAPDAAAGLETFRSVGCAACHGSDGEGAIGPPLAGHTEEQVFRQVRTPKGDVMPAFPPDVLSDEEVLSIVAWITTLGEEMVMAHGPEEGDEVGHGDEPASDHELVLTGTEIAHMRLMISAVEVGNLDDAGRHLEHMTLHGAEPEIVEFVEGLQADLAAGNLHDVEGKAVEALGSAAKEDFDAVVAHMGMTISASQRDDAADVEFHLAKAVEEGAGEDHGADLEQLLEDWRNDVDRHGVIDALYAALGQSHPSH